MEILILERRASAKETYGDQRKVSERFETGSKDNVFV